MSKTSLDLSHLHPIKKRSKRPRKPLAAAQPETSDAAKEGPALPQPSAPQPTKTPLLLPLEPQPSTAPAPSDPPAAFKSPLKTPRKSPRKTPRKTPLKSPAKGLGGGAVAFPGESPRKAVREPLCGVEASFRGPPRGEALELFLRSPDTALRRPLKRSLSSAAVRSLSLLPTSPAKKLRRLDDPAAASSSSQGAEDGAAEEEGEEDGENYKLQAFKDARPLKVSNENFVKIDLRKKNYTRNAKKLKGKAYKRSQWKMQQRFQNKQQRKR